MEWLVLVHVLSAVVGVGPVFLYPVLYRSNQSRTELAHAVRISAKLDLFPKIGGTIAVLSGLGLALGGGYGPFMQLWLFGSLVLYVTIQAIVIGVIAPRVRKLEAVLTESPAVSGSGERLHANIRLAFWIACALGFVLFILMIAKPGVELTAAMHLAA